MRINPLRLFDTKHPRVAEIMAGAPKLLDNLSPAAQAHRERVLEALGRLGIAYERGPLPRARLRLLHDDRLRVHQRRASAPRAPWAAAGATTAWWRASAARPPRASASAPASSGSCSRWRPRAPTPGRRSTVYVAVLDAEDLRLEMLPVIERLRAAGLRCESDLARARPEGHDEARRQLSARATCVIVGAARARGAASPRCATCPSGEQREVPLGGPRRDARDRQPTTRTTTA